jgi:anti-anti-sigma regulatory factor
MKISRDGTAAIFQFTREDLSLIIPTLAAVETELKEECAQVIVADLAAFESIYSLQIGSLAAMHVLCYENLAVMKLMNVHEHVKQQLTLVGLDKLMELHHGAGVAKESFGKKK